MEYPAIRIEYARLYLLPVETRVPLKFGAETLTHVTCARVELGCHASGTTGSDSTVHVGWGETPLNVQWVWPSAIPYVEREHALVAFTRTLLDEWVRVTEAGHPVDLGHRFLTHTLPVVRERFNRDERAGAEPLPELAALVCCSPFDLALHDAYGKAVGKPVYECYGPLDMPHDLSEYFGSTEFAGRYVADYLRTPAGPGDPSDPSIPAWHLVGGRDAVEQGELTGEEPDDGYPVLLEDWIRTDGLRCLKVKLTGDDAKWDLQRLMQVGRVARENGVEWLSADFNCRVTEPAYVNDILDSLQSQDPETWDSLLYVEQPFPYDLEANRIDVHSVAERKPLFMDESAHDWKIVRLGYELGWNGVALKTCKTQTGALLSLCWARQHGMQIMVQDLTNPMLAQISHVQLGYYAGTIMGVETNGMQFYPEASTPEATVHPGLYRRRDGQVDLSSCLGLPGFGYRTEDIDRQLPRPELERRNHG
ncbi:MAG: hypothetical protein EA383_11470 [Spirochaetaceae bacterium]|nr:MAG: hypothetical protein EA383_11470 [Spirochaetaceae bacterium]